MAKQKKSLSMKCEKISLPIVEDLEKSSKVGFYVEQRTMQYPDELTAEIEPLVRLRCESKDGESEDLIVTPYMSVQTLVTMLQGAMLLHPALINVIKQIQSNAPKPEEQ